MRVLIEPENVAGEQMVVEEGKPCRIGRRAPAEFVCADDSFLSGLHFAVNSSGSECRLRDLDSSNGTFLNGYRVTEAILKDGDCISAGQARFRIRFEKEEFYQPILPLLSPSELKEPHGQLLEILGNAPEPLFALLDAARDDQVLDLLRRSGEKYQSLYEGPQGKELDTWAPHLVALPKDSRLLPWLVHEGWRKNWGVYLTSGKPLAEVRKHFRHFLMVEDEDGQQLYFRFYDPRVLRVFLSTYTQAECDEFFGPITSYLMEGEDPSQVMQFTNSHQKMQQRTFKLSRQSPETVLERPS